MNDFNELHNRTQMQAQAQAKSTATIFMQQVYLWMCIALGVTAVAAYAVGSSEQLMTFFFANSISYIVLVVALFGLVIYLSARIHTMSASTATSLFMVYSGVMGITLAPVTLIYTQASIASTFVIAAGMFGGMSVYGMVTKKDLTSMGSFLMMGLWGIILASLVNIFLQNSMMEFIISLVGVIVFAGLTAYDTQKIRQMGESAPLDDATAIRRGALLGALTLYLDFINLFLMLLRLFGERR